MDISHAVFYLVFLCQIFLISFYYPRKVLRRMEYIRETYPRSDYPKLYPKSEDYDALFRTLFRTVNQLIFFLGFVLLFAIYRIGPQDDGTISEAWPAAYGMLQMLPLIGLELAEFSRFRQMRRSNTSSVRKASLRPRRLFDHVSPWLVGAAALAFLAFVALDLYLHDFLVQWDRVGWLTFSNLFMASFGAYALYGKKADPHQSQEDRARLARLSLRSVLYVSILSSVFFMYSTVDQVIQIDHLDAPFLSLFLQATVFLSIGGILRDLEREDVDFSVYESEPTAS